MPRYFKIDSASRIIDANLNRAKEGLRVCEEIARFVLGSRSITSEFKKMRHRIEAMASKLPVSFKELLKTRKSLSDVGKGIYINELERENLSDIFFANIQRVKESVRVLEEFSKLISRNLAVGFKRLRYEVYDIEKRAAKRI